MLGTEVASASLSGKLEVTIPEETHTAGSPSVVRVVIHNPFPVEVEILEVLAPQSSLVRRVKNSQESQRREIAKEDDSGRSYFSFSKESFGSWAGSLLSGLATSSVSIAGMGISAEFPSKVRRFALNAEPGSEVKIERDLSDFDDVVINSSESSKVTIAAPKDNFTALAPETHKIQPHCDKVAYFSIMSNGWLFFTPQRINLSTEIRYRISGEERTQVVTSYFDIKPPLSAMIIGSLIGGCLGSAARLLTNGAAIDTQSAIVTIGASIIMSLIAAIALSRKSGTQGFITVEDFFGAFVIGALIGYGGSEYFDKAILPPEN